MAQALNEYLGSGDALGRLREHVRKLRALQAQVESLLPPALARSCPVANFKGGTLLLLAHNGSAAARIRQLLPTLQRQLAESGMLVGKIEVKVKPVIAAPPPPPRTQRAIGQAALCSLHELEHSLPEGSELRKAVAQLISRARTRHD